MGPANTKSKLVKHISQHDRLQKRSPPIVAGKIIWGIGIGWVMLRLRRWAHAPLGLLDLRQPHWRRPEPAGYRDSARALAQWVASACRASGLVVEACVLRVSPWKSRSPLRPPDGGSSNRPWRVWSQRRPAQWLCAGYIGSISEAAVITLQTAHDGRATREKSANAARKQQRSTSQPGRSRIQRTSQVDYGIMSSRFESDHLVQ
jgi:hypothetical protein